MVPSLLFPLLAACGGGADPAAAGAPAAPATVPTPPSSGVTLAATPTDAAAVPPAPPHFADPTAAQLARKSRSEARLRAEGVPVHDTLPVIEDVSTAKVRAQAEVVDRAIALMLVAVKGEGLEQAEVLSWEKDLGAAALLSPKETRFVADPQPSTTDRAQFAWQYEDLAVMHWALGYTPTLAAPVDIVDAGLAVRLVLKPGAAAYRAGAHLRSAEEVLDEADLIYRYDWACVDARVRGAAPPPVNCEIVVERHHALNWLYGYQGQAWDDVSTDT